MDTGVLQPYKSMWWAVSIVACGTKSTVRNEREQIVSIHNPETSTARQKSYSGTKKKIMTLKCSSSRSVVQSTLSMYSIAFVENGILGFVLILH